MSGILLQVGAGVQRKFRNEVMNGSMPSLRRSQRKEVLGAFHGVLQAAEELLQVGAAFYEVDFGGVDYKEVGGGVAEEEMFVGAGDFLDVLEGDLGFFAGAFFDDAGGQHCRRDQEIEEQSRAARVHAGRL